MDKLVKANAELRVALDAERKRADALKDAAKRARRDVDELHAAIAMAQQQVNRSILGSAGIAPALLGPALSPVKECKYLSGGYLADRKYPIPDEKTVARAVARVSVPPASSDFPDPDDRQAELDAEQRRIADSLPEDDGYTSAWEVRSTTPLKHHHEWRAARRSYVATGSPEAMDSMLRYVTAVNPPMRAERPLEARRKPRSFSRAEYLGTAFKGVVVGTMAGLTVTVIGFLLLMLAITLIHLIP